MPSASDYAHDYYRSNVEETTKSKFGTVTSGADGATVVQLANPGLTHGRGMYEVWGYGYSSVANGLKLDLADETGADLNIAAPANTLVYFGPVFVNIDDDTDDITVQCNGGTNNASCTIHAKRRLRA